MLSLIDVAQTFDVLAALPHEILHLVADNSGLVDALAFCCVCRVTNAALGKTCAFRLQLQEDGVMSCFPEHVRRSVPMRVWLQFSWIDFSPKWLGSTGYVDGVKHSDVIGSPFKCSRDIYGRLVLLMRRQRDVAVLFQRYTDTNAVWAFASNSLPISGCRLSDSMAARLALWLAQDYADFSSV